MDNEINALDVNIVGNGYVVKESFSQEDENIVDDIYTVTNGVRHGLEIKNKGESAIKGHAIVV